MSSINKPQGRTGSIVTTLLLTLGILFVLNLVSSFFFLRLDLSRNHVHSLSKSSKQIVRKLDDNIVVKAYFSKNLPPDYSVLTRYARDILGEYKIYGGSRFRYEVVNQNNDEAYKAEATRNGVYAQKVMLLENDQQTVREIYMGLSIEYKGNHEAINLSKDMEGRMEYEITSVLRRLTKASLPKIYVFQDSLYNEKFYQTMEHDFEQNYDVLPTNLLMPEMRSSVLVMPGVVDSISQIQLYNLDQFIMHGGKVLFMQDHVMGLVQYGQAEVFNSNVLTLLQNYGIDIRPRLVMDQDCASLTLSQRSGIFVVDVPVPFPPIPYIQGNKNSPLSRNLSDIIYYLGSDITPKSIVPGVTLTPLLTTSQNSGVLNGPEFDITPESFMEKKLTQNLNMPPLTVSVLAKGTFRSYFANNPSVRNTPGYLSQTNKSQIIAIGDADIAREFTAKNSPSNMIFILNCIDYLLGDTTMIEVRSRSIPNSSLSVPAWLYKLGYTPDEIQKLDPKVRNVIKGINLLLPSLFIIILGLIITSSARKRRQRIRKRYELLQVLPSQSDTPQEDKQ